MKVIGGYMKITKLTKRLGRTINLGNFNSATFVEEATVELSDSDNTAEVDKMLYSIVAQMLTDDINRMREDRKNAKNKQKQTTS